MSGQTFPSGSEAQRKYRGGTNSLMYCPGAWTLLSPPAAVLGQQPPGRSHPEVLFTQIISPVSRGPALGGAPERLQLAAESLCACQALAGQVWTGRGPAVGGVLGSLEQHRAGRERSRDAGLCSSSSLGLHSGGENPGTLRRRSWTSSRLEPHEQ